MSGAVRAVTDVASGFGDTVGGVIGGITGSTRAAEAAGAAASAQERMARQQQELILERGQAEQDAAMELAAASPQELIAYEKQLDTALSQIARRQRMIDAIDPALMEASEQVLALLQGEEAGLTKASNQQRQMQRQELINTLRAQYGPGAETSSIGQQALQRFDSETNMLTQNTQQSALATAFGIASSAPGLTDINSAMSGLQSAGSNFSNLQQRQLDARMQTGSNILSGIAGTAQSRISSAGSQYVSPMLQAQQQAGLFNDIIKSGAQAGFAAMGKP